MNEHDGRVGGDGLRTAAGEGGGPEDESACSRLLSIGELARRTGLSVSAVRFYSDEGIVAPAARSPAGYRLYRADATARLNLVRTLRALGVPLPTVRALVEGRSSLAEVATTHIDALDAQIRVLRRHRAVLETAARHGLSAEELDLMHQRVGATERERHRIVAEFLDTTLGTVRPHRALEEAARSLTPELPSDTEPGPDAEQMSAWAELTELLADSEFRTRLRRAAELFIAFAEDAPGPEAPPQDPFAAVREVAGAALTQGIGPEAAEAAPFVAALLDRYGERTGRLLALLEYADDPERDRYARLLAKVNGWPAPQPPGPGLDWARRALTGPGGRDRCGARSGGRDRAVRAPAVPETPGGPEAPSTPKLIRPPATEPRADG
ncbi:MerR family transcriptional regulator [Streptomyces sp. NPDC049954]|uniref:MerR family transcriptional regulator n=1 Tax=Streptomyces sp. NPDC049954 TaxID=3155779 RepID=UPI003435DB7B